MEHNFVLIKIRLCSIAIFLLLIVSNDYMMEFVIILIKSIILDSDQCEIKK